MRIAIIGAGPMGLTAAFHLAKAGRNVTIFEADGHDYIALLPLEGEDFEDGSVYLYRYAEVDGEPELQNIETDEEYDIVSDAFDEWLDTQEYDEIVDEEDLEDDFEDDFDQE